MSNQPMEWNGFTCRMEPVGETIIENEYSVHQLCTESQRILDAVNSGERLNPLELEHINEAMTTLMKVMEASHGG